MMDDRFDDFLRDAAQSYNTPPATPREEIWERVRAARDEAVHAGHAPADVRPIGSAPSRRRAWLPWMGGIAAALLIGIGIGRLSSVSTTDAPPTTTPSIATVPDTPATPAALPSGPPSAPQADSGVPSPQQLVDNTPNPKPPKWGRGVPPSTAQRIAANGGGEMRPAPDAGLESGLAPTTAYRVAAARHLGQAEALLTSFRASRVSGVDAYVSAWADDLLSTTRLLLDSPAGSDAAMRKLLGDLELVLAQIAQLPARREARELELIEQSVEQRNVLPRLRALVPAGFRPAGA
ncbi:MAG: hypothetical protein ACREON_13395 [Gemmatimonadaceae bacterium]